MIKSIIIPLKDAKPKPNQPKKFCKIFVKMSLHLFSLFYQPWTCLIFFASVLLFILLVLASLLLNSWKSAAICINATWWWWCYPTPSEGWERRGIPRRLNSRAATQDLEQRSKMEEVVYQRWLVGEAQIRDNPEGGELDPADDVCRCCKKNSPYVLSCIGKRTKEGCDRISEVGTVHSGWNGEGPVSPRKSRILAEERVVRMNQRRELDQF